MRLLNRVDLGSRARFLLIAVVLIGALVALRAADPSPLRNLRSAYFDYLQILSPRPYTPLPVVIVDLDEASLAKLGQWPWPRDRLATMIDRLRELGAAVVVFDILFAEVDRLSPKNLLDSAAVRDALGAGPWTEKLSRLDNDAIFAKAMSRIPVVLGISDAGLTAKEPVPSKASFVFLGQDPGKALVRLRSSTTILPEMEKAAAGLGVVNVNPLESNDRIRSVPLVWQSGDGFMPGLALEALRVALGVSTIAVKGSNSHINQVEAIRVGGYTIPTGANGLFPLHYRSDKREQYVPAYTVLDPLQSETLRAKLKGSIVFVGASAAGLSDIRTTALGERVPGVSVHAQIVEQILLGDFLTRTTATQGAEVAAFAGLGLLVTIVLLLTGPIFSILAGAIGGAGVLGASWYAYTHIGQLFDVTFPLLGGFLAFSVLAMFQFAVADRDKRIIRRSFAHYVAPSVLHEMDKTGHSLELGGITGEVTVLFCDIRNFTPLAATMTAQDLVALLNEIFTALSDEILGQSGTIDKYIGDEIMAFWNAPLATPQHQRRAGIATLRMRAALGAYNARKAALGIAPVFVGMGLDCGLACVGNIGSRDRFNYTAIGDTVNVAARTQSACRHVNYDILVTADVARAAPTLGFLPAGHIALKGVADRTEVFILVGDEDLARSETFTTLRTAHQDLLDGLRTGEGSIRALADAAAHLGAALDPRLPAFYDTCLKRPDDFRI